MDQTLSGVGQSETEFSLRPGKTSDNAEGHGTNDATARYTSILWNEFKVEMVWQVPRSPETNMLDLGIWMSI